MTAKQVGEVIELLATTRSTARKQLLLFFCLLKTCDPEYTRIETRVNSCDKENGGKIVEECATIWQH